MKTKYHIGDMFSVPKRAVVAVIVKVHQRQYHDPSRLEDIYSMEFLDKRTHELYEGIEHFKKAWWTNQEIEKDFIPMRVWSK